MKQEIALVTGANTGIGFEIARGLAGSRRQVVIACRNREKGEQARSSLSQATGNREIELLVMDASSQKSIRAAADEFLARHGTLDVLVNNAATSSETRSESPDGIELTFATNVLGYFLLTKLLLHGLRQAPAARVVNMASMMAYGLDLSDVEFKRRRYDAAASYAQSKQANRMLTWALARKLEGTSVSANAMSPGVVDTPLLHALAPGMRGKTPAEGADTAIWLATSPEMAGVGGKLWVGRREKPCEFRGRENEDALWSLCERMTGEPASASVKA